MINEHDINSKDLLEDVAREIVKIAQDEAPIVTGELKSSIDVLDVTETEATVGHKYNDKIVVNWGGVKTIYPLFVHEGTSAHIIAPKTKKALFGDKAIGARKRVNHPGTKANPYFTRAIQNKRIQNILAKHGNKLIIDIAKDINNSNNL